MNQLGIRLSCSVLMLLDFLDMWRRLNWRSGLRDLACFNDRLVRACCRIMGLSLSNERFMELAGICVGERSDAA